MDDEIRIKDLQSTASYMESDDYLPIDSLALGNRKIPFTGLMDSEDDRLPTTDKTLRGAITEHEGDITEIKQSLSNLVKSTTVTGTTTSSGALAIPNELKSKPLIDLHYDSANGLVFRRDNDYLTCLALSLQPFSNTSVSITVWYLDV